jgi:hypothetical protein
MNGTDLDNAIAQAEQFLIFAKELRNAFHEQSEAMRKTREQAIANNLKEDEIQKLISNAKYSNEVTGTRIIGAVKHACVTLSFSLAKLRK